MGRAATSRAGRNEEYDRSWKAAETEMDPVKRAAHFIRMNDLLIQNVVVDPGPLAERRLGRVQPT